MQCPPTTAICGILAWLSLTWLRNTRPPRYRSGNTPCCSGRKPPALSQIWMTGRRFSSATSRRRTTFLTVCGYQAPPLTLASLAWMATSRPCTIPMPVTTAAPGTVPSYSRQAASVENSKNGVPGSSSSFNRSRTPSLFWRARRSISRCGRSKRAACWRAWNSFSRSDMAAKFAL